MTRRFILTGAPGAGKTTIIAELRNRGLAVVEEAATDVIAREQANGVAEPWLEAGFTGKIAALQEERVAAETAPLQFHDRSVFCTLALARYLGHPVPTALEAAVERAADGIFERRVLFPRLLGFITPTAARRITLSEAQRFEAMHEDVYGSFGFEMIFLAPEPVEARAEAVLRAVPELPSAS